MKSQKLISTFFKPESAGAKRVVRQESSDEPSSKRQKSSRNKENAEIFSKVSRLPYNEDIERKRLAAKIKLQVKRTPVLSANIGLSWFKALEPEFCKEYFLKLNDFVVAERQRGTVYPPEDQVYTWTQLCDIRKVKVVILGQDPYHGPGQAHGLAFSVPKNIAIPPSLHNMYKELATDIPGFEIPNHGNLTGWALQGVLLLNACLTVRAHNANSHKEKGWENLTDAVIKWLDENLTNVVFLLWGSYAHKKGAYINKKKHLVLQCPHPSPLSVARGFFGCHHFSKCNDYLRKCNKSPVDWSDLPSEV